MKSKSLSACQCGIRSRPMTDLEHEPRVGRNVDQTVDLPSFPSLDIRPWVEYSFIALVCAADVSNCKMISSSSLFAKLDDYVLLSSMFCMPSCSHYLCH